MSIFTEASNLINGSNIAAALATVFGTLFTVAVFGIPYWRRMHVRLLQNERTNKAVKEVILGRPAGEPNLITGEPGLPKLPGIAERMNGVNELASVLQTNQQIQIQLLDTIAKEVRINSESRISKLEDLVEEMRSQLRALYNQLHHSVIGREEMDDSID
jgi:hypothetical protein